MEYKGVNTIAVYGVNTYCTVQSQTSPVKDQNGSSISIKKQRNARRRSYLMRGTIGTVTRELFNPVLHSEYKKLKTGVLIGKP